MRIVSGVFAALTAAEYLSKTQYIILLSSSAGGVLLLLIVIAAVRMRRYRKKIRALQNEDKTKTTESAPSELEAIDARLAELDAMSATADPDGKLKIALEKIELSERREAVKNGAEPGTGISESREQQAARAYEALRAFVEAEAKAAGVISDGVNVAAARKKAQIIALRSRLKNAVTVREAEVIKDRFNAIARGLTDEERENAELKSLIARSIEDAGKAAAAAAERSAQRRVALQRRVSGGRAVTERREPRRPAYYDEYGRAVYLDEYNRPYIIERRRVFTDYPDRRAIDRDRAEKERLYRERQRRMRERDGRDY